MMATYQGLAPSLYKEIIAKTADYVMKADDIGKLFTNRGASGAVTLTLPPTNTIENGWGVDVFVVADQNLTVETPDADTLVAFNDANADSAAFSTASEKVGGGGRFIWDGTGWLFFANLGMDSQTITIAT